MAEKNESTINEALKTLKSLGVSVDDISEAAETVASLRNPKTRTKGSAKDTKNSILEDAISTLSAAGLSASDILDMFTGSSSSSSSKKKPSSSSSTILDKILGTEKVDYPQFSEKSYWAIREKLQKSCPEKFTAATFTGCTGLKADTVKSTILPALELMGMTKDNKPTTRLKNWLNDNKYESACADILEKTYPKKLRDTKATASAVTNWFVKNNDDSEAAAKKRANIYLLLANPELKTKSTSSASKKPSSASDTNSVKVTKKSGKATITVKAVIDADCTKKALTELFADLANDAWAEMK